MSKFIENSSHLKALLALNNSLNALNLYVLQGLLLFCFLISIWFWSKIKNQFSLIQKRHFSPLTVTRSRKHDKYHFLGSMCLFHKANLACSLSVTSRVSDLGQDLFKAVDDFEADAIFASF